MNTRFQFWLILLATLLGVGITLALGYWQYGRGLLMQAQDAALVHQRNVKPLPGAELAGLVAPAQQMHRAVLVQGRWRTEHTVFLDNRPMNGKAGLVMLTPLEIEGSGVLVMVQRGWLARNFLDRTALLQVPSAAGLVTIAGRIAPWPSKLYEIAGAGTGLIRQNLDWAQYRNESGLALLEVTIKQTGQSGDGLTRDWPETQGALRKHFGYALQWWGISALLIILYVWFQIVRRYYRRPRP